MALFKTVIHTSAIGQPAFVPNPPSFPRNTMTRPDDFSHHLSENRRVNALDNSHDRCYPKQTSKVNSYHLTSPFWRKHLITSLAQGGSHVTVT
jgi:hypothetical protein